jgi:hypothetical protein
MIAEVGEERIREVWKIKDMRPENKHTHFIIIIDPVSYLCSCMSNISRGIICRHYFRVMMTSTFAGFQIQMIPSRWYNNIQKDKEMVVETCFISKEAAENFLGVTLTPNSLTVPTTVTNILRRAAKKRLKYGEVWGLARQAAQLAVEHDNHNEIIGWLKEFINRNKEMTINTRLAQNQDLLEYSEVQADDDKENVPVQIENPLVSRRKGRLEIKRHKSSTEKQPRATKYTCKTCGQIGHNSARCQNR